MIYNVCDVPVGVLPVTRVDPVRDALTAEWTEGAYTGSALLEGRLYRHTWGREPWYDARRMGGMPVGIQLAGRRWEEEKVVAMMRVVDAALGERGFGPGSLGRA